MSAHFGFFLEKDFENEKPPHKTLFLTVIRTGTDTAVLFRFFERFAFSLSPFGGGCSVLWCAALCDAAAFTTLLQNRFLLSLIVYNAIWYILLQTPKSPCLCNIFLCYYYCLWCKWIFVSKVSPKSNKSKEWCHCEWRVFREDSPDLPRRWNLFELARWSDQLFARARIRFVNVHLLWVLGRVDDSNIGRNRSWLL